MKYPGERCPRCGEEEEIDRIRDHASHGVNSYVCKKCGQEWGN